jgi:aldehyde:ferredoxin oxidoreductase
MAKALNVNLESGECTLEDLTPELSQLGGRGLSSAIIAERVDPKTDPLGPGNVLVIAAGLLAGTPVPNGGRLSVGGKSPLTGGIKEANAGGTSARKLANLGIRAVTFEGQAAEPCILVINAKGATVKPANDLWGDLWGLGTYATVERLRSAFGDQVGIVCCGPAGEMLYKNSAVVSTTADFYPRTASRGGLGAVMGSKKLKALVIDDMGERQTEIAEPQALRRAVTVLTNGIRSDQFMHYLKDTGTACLITLADQLECLATKNFSSGQFADNYEISGEKIAWLANDRPNAVTKHRCMPECVIHCSSVFTDDDGNYVTSGFEFETLALLGSNCMISDVDILARIDWLCDDLGIDTIETGGAIGVAMEGGLIPWGDGEAAYNLIKEIGEGTENGKLIGNGCLATGTALGVKRIPVVKGQGISAWEPRVLKATGATYATSPMGADHTCGNALPGMDYDPTVPEGQAEKSLELQKFFAAIDTLGLCVFPAVAISAKSMLEKKLVEATGAILGEDLPADYLFELGAKVLALEVDFNRRAGFTKKDDRLPTFMVEEPVSPSDLRFDVTEEDLDSIFK